MGLLHPRRINDKQQYQECVASKGGSKGQVAIEVVFSRSVDVENQEGEICLNDGDLMCTALKDPNCGSEQRAELLSGPADGRKQCMFTHGPKGFSTPSVE